MLATRRAECRRRKKSWDGEEGEFVALAREETEVMCGGEVALEIIRSKNKEPTDRLARVWVSAPSSSKFVTLWPDFAVSDP